MVKLTNFGYRVLPFCLALSPSLLQSGCRISSVAATRHLHTKLHRRLVDSGSIRAGGGSTSRCCSRSHESVGVETERQEECAFSITENHLSWCGVGSTTIQARMSPARIKSTLLEVRRVKEGQSLTVKQFQRLLGLMAACVQLDIYWPAVHETPTVVAQDQGVLPEGKPASHAQGHVAVPTCLRHVETSLVLVSRPGAGTSVSPCNASEVGERSWMDTLPAVCGVVAISQGISTAWRWWRCFRL